MPTFDPWIWIVFTGLASALLVSIIRLIIKLILRRHFNDTTSRIINKALRPAQIMAATGGVQILLYANRKNDDWGHDMVGSESEGWNPTLSTIIMFVTVASGAWLISNLLSVAKDPVEQRWGSLDQHDIDGRKKRTQIIVAFRLISAAIWMIAIGIIMLNVDALKILGTSLLASAGLAGVVAALAAQTMLANLFAGISLAFGDAVRLEDVVVIEGEWGRIEEITLSYVVIRIWDERRLVLPSKYFQDNAYVNWTRNNPEVLGTIRIDVDWRLPVEVAREELHRYLISNPLWDGRKYGIVVLRSVGPHMQLRITISAGSPSDQWDLRCSTREHMIAWVVEKYPHCIPRMRVNTSESRVDTVTGEISEQSVEHRTVHDMDRPY